MVFALMGMLAGGRGLHRFGAAQFGDQRARPARRALYHRGRGDRRHIARRRRRHDLRRADRRARHPVAAVGHGAARLRLRPSSRWSSAWCWSAPSASTPSIAAEPRRVEPWTLRPNSARRDEGHFARLRRREGRRPRLYRSLCRRGRGPARPQRRRQVVPDQDPVGRLQARRRADLHQRRRGARSTTRATPSTTASRRSTRRSRSPTTSMRRRISISAARSSPAGARSTTRRWKPRRAR